DVSANENLNNPITCKGPTTDSDKGKQPIYELKTYSKHSSDKKLENTNATNKTNRPSNNNKKIERNEDRQKRNPRTDIQRYKKPLDKDTRISIQNKNKTSNKKNSN
ncbi:15847_t:CDS:1, partial [Dentiscutata heterogama]